MKCTFYVYYKKGRKEKRKKEPNKQSNEEKAKYTCLKIVR
jgi:hypothetical protein